MTKVFAETAVKNVKLTKGENFCAFLAQWFANFMHVTTITTFTWEGKILTPQQAKMAAAHEFARRNKGDFKNYREALSYALKYANFAFKYVKHNKCFKDYYVKEVYARMAAAAA